MRLGIMMDMTQKGVAEAVDDIVRAEREGFDSYWVPHIMTLDALTILAVAGGANRRIHLGTAVVPIQPRHPSALAQQALSVAEACEGRFTLGIGLSHKLFVENMLGLNYTKPAAHMREYLEVLTPLLRGQKVDFKGTHYRVQMELQHKPIRRIRLLLAALGPLMLDLAGQYADGTITWMTGPRTLEKYIRPHLQKAAAHRQNFSPRIVAGFPIALTNNVNAVRPMVEQQLRIYGILPSYKAMLDREGVNTPGKIALLGNETNLRRRLAQLRDIGINDFEAFIVPLNPETTRRTRAFLSAERDTYRG